MGRPNGTELTKLLRDRARVLSPEAKFPSVRELMAEYGVSQSIVSQAILMLQHEGLIESQVGRGTFISENAPLRRVLWVCGIDLFHGDISPYYSHLLRYSKVALAQRGISMDPAWLSNFRREDSEVYCTPASLDRYVGYLFCGCSPDHPLIEYVARNDAPFAAITVYECGSSHAVVADTPHMLKQGFAHLHAKGHRDVTLMTHFNDWHCSLAQEVATSVGVQVQILECPVRNWAVEQERYGYLCMRQEIASRGLPGALFIPDDITAKGATRALLEMCDRKETADLDIVVSSANECRPPLGLPVTWLLIDIEEETIPAVNMLCAQLEGRQVPRQNPVLVRYRLVTGTDEADPMRDVEVVQRSFGESAFASLPFP